MKLTSSEHLSRCSLGVVKKGDEECLKELKPGDELIIIFVFIGSRFYKAKEGRRRGKDGTEQGAKRTRRDATFRKRTQIDDV